MTIIVIELSMYNTCNCTFYEVCLKSIRNCPNLCDRKHMEE